jgi:hypothetical protein
MGELNVHNLKEFMDSYGCSVFVETGTGIGTGLKYAHKFPFERFYSIEINHELFNRNKNKFNGKVTLINDSSPDGLIQVGQYIKNDICLFWLDAHFPGADFQLDTYKGVMRKYLRNTNLPAIKELRTLSLIRPKKKDVIIVDDLCLFEDGPYELKPGLDRKKYGYPSIKPIYEMYEKTHNIKKVYRHQGSLVLTPKAA